MPPTTNRIMLAAALAVASFPALAQSGAPIPEGRAFVCSYDRAVIEVRGKRSPSGVRAQGMVTSKLAYHCAGELCSRYKHSPELSQKTQFYIGDDGTRLMTNALALDLDGGITILGLDKRADTSILFSGRCVETAEQEIASVIKAIDKRVERSKPRPKR